MNRVVLVQLNIYLRMDLTNVTIFLMNKDMDDICEVSGDLL